MTLQFHTRSEECWAQFTKPRRKRGADIPKPNVSWAWWHPDPTWDWAWTWPSPTWGASTPIVELGMVMPVHAWAQRRAGRGLVHAHRKVGRGCAPAQSVAEHGRLHAQHSVGRGCTPTQLKVGHPKRYSPILGYDFRALSLKWGWFEKPWPIRKVIHTLWQKSL